MVEFLFQTIGISSYVFRNPKIRAPRSPHIFFGLSHSKNLLNKLKFFDVYSDITQFNIIDYILKNDIWFENFNSRFICSNENTTQFYFFNIKVKYHEEFEKNIKNKYIPVIDYEISHSKNNQDNNEISFEQNGINIRQISNSKIMTKNHKNNSYISNNGNLKDSCGGGEKILEENSLKSKMDSLSCFDLLNYENNNPYLSTNELINNNKFGKQYATLLFNLSEKFDHTQPNIINDNSIYNVNSFDSNIIKNENILINGANVNQVIKDKNCSLVANNKILGIMQKENLEQYSIEIATSVYKAIYDYDAQEEDEISFRDGDRFTNCEYINEGWMIGKCLYK